MPGHRVPAAAGDPGERDLEPVVLEGLDLAAVVTHEVMVVLAVRERRLVARHAVAEIHALDQPCAVETFERAVDARDPESYPAGPDAVVDFLSRRAAVLPTEEIHDLAPRRAAPAAVGTKARQSRFDPRRAHGR